ncbi:hypothetical protein LEP1GSC168_1613 [Leptospira santarosai str. HAI134]|nr:hypothetical protein LEP1GSC039_2530 [Leptospira santarosai str. 2000027870]EMO22573.1 hypothetical protein LEP1GSC168_1613 [Leptospira santarosai str. HAI134]EMP82254.1 hypothetical protein LEP1GSC162_2500 [Leptospira santarosai str. CBC1531]
MYQLRLFKISERIESSVFSEIFFLLFFDFQRAAKTKIIPKSGIYREKFHE